jgi:hypothetical protein
LTLPMSSFMERRLETVDREEVDRVAVDREGGATGAETLILG